jgi:acetolactate synthase-1/2/3 large subunit
MILFIGDVGSDFRDREAFQEVDFREMFRPLAKWVERSTIPRASRVHRARLRDRDGGTQGARWCWRCPRTC